MALRHLAYQGEDGSSIRWFAEYDASVQALRHRHARMLLADLVVIMQGASPFNAAVDFTDDLAEVFRKSGQSMQAACHVLRDESLFQATPGIQPSTPTPTRHPDPTRPPLPTTSFSLTLPTQPPRPLLPTLFCQPPAPTQKPTYPQHSSTLIPGRSYRYATTSLPGTAWNTACVFSRIGVGRARSR